LARHSKNIFSALLSILKVLLALAAGYVLVMVGIVVWTFEVKLSRWPVFVYSAPFTLRVGDDILNVKLAEHLSRISCTKTDSAVPEIGQWNQAGSAINVCLAYSPFRGYGVASGPVSIGLDWNRVNSIRLMRSLNDTEILTFEPELLTILPAEGYPQEFCRPISLDQIPQLLVDAIVLTEDTRFFTHQGIDPISIGNALLANIKAGRYAHGASTITQQLIRMTLLTPEKTLFRKINEIVFAIAADAIYSKKTILQAYLNRVYFGHWGAYPVKGVAEAAQFLFGKDLAELDPAECGLMAAIIKAPNIINPFKHPERARARRNMVLGLLLKEGKISRDQYDDACNSSVNMRKSSAPVLKAPAFVEFAKELLPRDLPGPDGARQDVLTSLDPILQQEAEHLLKGFGDSGLSAHVVVTNPETGELKAYISPGPQKWSGTSTSLDNLLPLVLIPALLPERIDQVKYTLTSQVFVSQESGGPLTFREAFRKERQALFQKVWTGIGPEKITPVLKEFGVQVQTNGDKAATNRLSPIEIAQIYSLMATLGNAAVLGPGIKIAGESSSEKQELRIRIPTNPAVIFMVNHMMKGLETVEIKERGQDKSEKYPSLFYSTDDQGIWSIAYSGQAAVVVRIPGTHSEKKVRKMTEKLLAEASSGNVPQTTPENIVFRNICVESGLRATSICSKVVREPFLKGTQPGEWCPMRHESKTKSSVRR
jgi:penicillin-binding protein 1B